MPNWFTWHRQEWIGQMLRVYGFINRHHLRRQFGISMPQASADLKTFQLRNKNYIRYDVTRKAYVLIEPIPEVG